MPMLRKCILTALSAFILLSCDDEPPEIYIPGSFVLYTSGDSFHERELHRQELETGRDEVLFTGSIVALSEIARDGRFLMQTYVQDSPSSSFPLFMVDRKGVHHQIPLPVPQTPSDEFLERRIRYNDEYHPLALSYDGAITAFLAWNRPRGSTDSSEWRLHLCLHHLNRGSTSTTDISSVLEQYYASHSSSFRPDRPSISNLTISNDGSEIVIRMTLMQMEHNAPEQYRDLILGGPLNSITVLDERLYGSGGLGIRSVMFDGKDGTLYVVETDHSVTAHDCRGSSWEAQSSQSDFRAYGFRRLSAVSGEQVYYNIFNQHITLERASDAHLHDVPFSLDDLTRAFPEVTSMLGTDVTTALGPDGEWVTFTAYHSMEEMGLYAVRRDGTGLRRISQGTFPLPPAVSDDIPRWGSVHLWPL